MLQGECMGRVDLVYYADGTLVTQARIHREAVVLLRLELHIPWLGVGLEVAMVKS